MRNPARYASAIVAVAALLYAWKSWDQICSGRLWAEEASVYLQQAVDTDVALKTLVSPALGYFSFLNRGCALLLASLPVAHVGPVSIGLALGLTLFLWLAMSRRAIAGVRTGTSHEFWAVVAFPLISVAIANGEMLANTLLLAYWYGGASAILIIVVSGDSLRISPISSGLLLGISALSGPHSIFVLVAGAVRFSLTRGLGTWIRRRDVGLYAMLAVLQLAFIVYSILTGDHQTTVAQGGERFASWTIGAAVNAVIKYDLIYPVYGYTLLDAHRALQVIAVLLALAGLSLCAWAGGTTTRACLASGLAMQALYLVAAVGSSGAPRYAYATNLVTLTAIVVVAASATRPGRVAACVLLAISMCVTLIDNEVRVGKFYDPAWPTYRESLRGACVRVSGGKSVCLSAWPIGNVSWQFCIPPGDSSGACN